MPQASTFAKATADKQEARGSSTFAKASSIFVPTTSVFCTRPPCIDSPGPHAGAKRRRAVAKRRQPCHKRPPSLKLRRTSRRRVGRPPSPRRRQYLCRQRQFSAQGPPCIDSPGPHGAKRQAGSAEHFRQPHSKRPPSLKLRRTSRRRACGGKPPHEREREAGRRFCAENSVFRAQKTEPRRSAPPCIHKWGGRRDSNPRPPGPQPGALTN